MNLVSVKQKKAYICAHSGLGWRLWILHEKHLNSCFGMSQTFYLITTTAPMCGGVVVVADCLGPTEGLLLQIKSMGIQDVLTSPVLGP